MLLSDHELQTRPDVVNGADFHIDKVKRQRDLSDDIFRDVGWHFRRLFGPADPDHAEGVQKRKQHPQFAVEQCAAGDEDVRKFDRRFRKVEPFEGRRILVDRRANCTGKILKPGDLDRIEVRVLW